MDPENVCQKQRCQSSQSPLILSRGNLVWDTGREAGLEWNTSEISASTSVFDVTQNESEELNFTVMSELPFGSSINSASCSTVPTQESIVADALAAWEHEDFAQNLTKGKLAEDKTSSKGNKRKNRQSVLPNESFLSETSENSINYSAIQSAVLLPKVNQLFSSQPESNFKHPVPSISAANTSLNNETSIINQTSINLPQLNKQGGTANNHMCHSSFNSSRSTDTSCTSESRLNSTYITSQNSSLVSDSSSNQTVGELNPSLITSTQPAKKRNARNSKSPSLPEEGAKKELNVPMKEVVKKKATKGAPKTKSKGTQVNLKTKASKNEVGPKKTTGKKVIRKKPSENKKENNQQIEEPITENITLANDLNNNFGGPSDFEIKSKETLLKEKVEELLNMPSTSNAVSDMNHTIGTVDMNMNYTIGNGGLDQSESENLISQSCSIEIIKDANRASKISITLPPETNLSLSKKNAATAKSKKKSLPSSMVKKDSLTVESNTPKQGKIKIKQEKISPKSVDLTSEIRPTKIKRGKEDTKDTEKRHSKKSETPKPGDKKHGKASPAPKTKRHTISCGYMSSSSSDDTDESYDSSEDSSSSCSCDCSDCAGSYCCCCSCTCSSCSESSYESPPRRRRHR